MSKQTNVVIFARVSTARQDTDRQVHELTEKAKSSSWNIVKVITEKISGAADKEDREGLVEVKELVEKGKVQKVLVHEITRLARRPAIIHEFVEFLHEHGVSLYWHQENQETLKANGQKNHMATLLIAILSGLAENEREVMKERVLSGLDAAKRAGKVLGRPVGYKETNERFLERRKEQIAILDRHPNGTLPELKKLTGLSVGTILKIRKIRAA